MSEKRERPQMSMFLYKLNKTDYDRQKKELEQAEMQASGKFPRRGPRKPKGRPATGNPLTTLL